MHVRMLYTTENVQRAKLAQIAATVLTVIVGCCVAMSMFSGAKEAIKSRMMLAEKKVDARKISQEAKSIHNHSKCLAPPCNGGVEVFAMEISRWAEKSGVKIESLTPEGSPVSSDVEIEDVKLGTWLVSKVRVKGHGDFGKLMSLLDSLRKPNVPVQLDCFELQSVSEGGNGNVSFNLLINVYEKKASAS